MNERAPTGDFINAPFTAEQVDALNRYQRLDHVHEFTCPDAHDGADRTLYATREGWRCPHCDYRQNWAHKLMLDARPLETMMTLVCDVMLPPATIIRKGCDYAALFAAFKARADRPAESNRFNDPTAPQPPAETVLGVQGSDYAYAGRLAGLAWKQSGALRYVVEDANGRLFIHNAKQIGKPEGWTP
jgi:hypothetical protein